MTFVVGCAFGQRSAFEVKNEIPVFCPERAIGLSPGLGAGLIEITCRDVGLRRAQSSRLTESGVEPWELLPNTPRPARVPDRQK
jgi:hypothetical protein